MTKLVDTFNAQRYYPPALWKTRNQAIIERRMCISCLKGWHRCESPGCPCVCNDKDFPWPPKEAN